VSSPGVRWSDLMGLTDDEIKGRERQRWAAMLRSTLGFTAIDPVPLVLLAGTGCQRKLFPRREVNRWVRCLEQGQPLPESIRRMLIDLV
jgi:hypothetical protein